jgi:hypothetical protein
LVAIGHLGISELKGNRQITVSSKETGTVLETVGFMLFRSEPVVVRIDPTGPSRTKVKTGDVIVAIDGHLITTDRAGKLFCDPPVGVPVELTLRRDGKTIRETIVPTWICQGDARGLMSHYILEGRVPPPEEELAEPARPARPAPPAEPAPPAPRDPSSALPWLGIALKCSIEGSWHSKNLRFTEPPEVFRVEPEGRAAAAGLKRRDVLTHIDGIPMDTVEGTDRFVEIGPGQEIEWTILRDGEPRTVDMAIEPLAQPSVRVETTPKVTVTVHPEVEILRYTGLLGDTAIEVRGSVLVNVTVDEENGQVIIRTPDTTIRLKKTD